MKNFLGVIIVCAVIIGCFAFTSTGQELTEKLSSHVETEQMRSDEKVKTVIKEALINTASEYVYFKKEEFGSNQRLTYEATSNLTQTFIKEVEIRKTGLTEQELIKLKELKEKKIKEMFNNVDKVFASTLS